MVDVKICGISDEAAVAAATRHGAAYLGFVFFARSPRHVSPAKAAQLGNDIPSTTRKVGLIVDEKNEGIATVLREFQPDFLQLHGKEPPERVAEIRARFGVPVIKAIAIADRADVAAA
ncbi:MAG TPA: N-(5'-phosphoribosyl)anthranilate isomerase, partial [Alphaproteobacteria bacterium]|nr:N-(5'-phosphoribosyl)anthranilate isomerase [Alphaproteobacteria bacterium]